MLADALTKRMPPDLLLKFLKDSIYCLKYDDVISNTKRVEAKVRKEARAHKKSAIRSLKSSIKHVRV